MNEIGVLSPERMRELWLWYQSQLRLPAPLTKHYPERRTIDEPSPHRVFIKNTENETIPPHACVRVIGVETVGGQTAIRVEKPSSTDGEFLFNGPYPIEAAAAATETEPAKFGVGWAFRFGVVIMLGEAPTVANAQYGPVVDSWEIEEGGGAFVVFGEHHVSDRALIGRFAAGSGGADIIQFRPVDVCEGVGFVCDCVTAEVVTASCGSSLQPGDTLQVWDQSRGWFQMDPVLLFNSVGWAHKVKTTEEDPYSLPFDIGPCRWVVISMDPVEQDPE